jgi:pimeloyl-ACP methyl ester carboxylesterase
VALKSGRKLCYFDESPADADPASLPVVLAIHGLGQGKELWMQPESVPNTRLLAIDRMGYGGSSQQPSILIS